MVADADEAPSEITVLTLNVWGLWLISKQRTERLIEIGRHIAHRDPIPHFVALQECFVYADYEAVRRETRFALPYGKYYRSGPFGSGLAILSRWPIEESWHMEYPLGGRPTAITQGDWYVGKGIASIRVRMGRLGDMVEVFNTHTQAPYGGESHTVHRLSQSWQLAKAFDGAARRGSLVLGLGDFNMKPCSLHHKIVTARAPSMKDTWRVLHPDSSLGSVHDADERARRRPVPTVEYNLMENGCTSNNATNTWRWEPSRRKLLGKKGVDLKRVTVRDDELDPNGHRLDYIFANVVGKEEGGEWEDILSTSPPAVVSPINSMKRSSSSGTVTPKKDRAQSPRDTGSFGTASDLESKFSSNISEKKSGKRGVHFNENPLLPLPTRDHQPQPQKAAKPVWVIRSARVALTERHPQLDCSLSDHYAYEVTLAKRVPKPPSMSFPSCNDESPPPSALKKPTADRDKRLTARPNKINITVTTKNEEKLGLGTYLESPTASERRSSSGEEHNDNYNDAKVGASSSAPATSADHDNMPLSDAQYAELVTLIQEFAREEQRSQQFCYAIFFSSLLVTVSLLIGIWFIAPRATYGVFIAMFFGLGIFATGLVAGYYGLTFLGRELRLLDEFEWEVMNAQAVDRGKVLEWEVMRGKRTGNSA